MIVNPLVDCGVSLYLNPPSPKIPSPFWGEETLGEGKSEWCIDLIRAVLA